MSQLAAASSRPAPKSLALRMPTPASLRSAARSLGLKKSKKNLQPKKCQTAFAVPGARFGSSLAAPAAGRCEEPSLESPSPPRRDAPPAQSSPPKKIQIFFPGPPTAPRLSRALPSRRPRGECNHPFFLCSSRPSHAKPNNKPALKMFCSRMLTNESTTMRAP